MTAGVVTGRFAGRRRGRGEEGSALVLALVFVTVIGLWISAVLSFADTSFRTTRAVARQRSLLYAADGAMDAVIRKVQAEGRCEDVYNAPETNGQAVKVDCQPPLKPNAHNQFLNPTRALVIGDSPQPLTADARLATGGADAASITLTGYGPATPTPPLTSAFLRISHADANVTLQATVVANPADPAAGAPVTVAVATHTGLSEDRVAISGLTGASLANAQVTFVATRASGNDATESLDGIWIEASYGAAPAGQTVTLKPSGHDQFDNPTNAYQMGESSPAVATASLSSTAATRASIVLSGYNRLTIPKDAVIEQATLRAAHGDDADIQSIAVRIEAAKRTDGSATPPIDLSADRSLPCTTVCLHPGVVEDDVDLLSRDLDDPAQFTALRISYTVTLAAGVNKAAAERLDAIWVDLSYSAEGFPHAAPDSKPANAILTLGASPSEDGVHLPAGSTVGVRNGVQSSSAVTVEAGATLDVQGEPTGDVKAAGACTGTITATGSVTCNTAVPGSPIYAAAIDQMPAVTAQAPTCKPVVTLAPGYYDDAAALSRLTSGSDCDAKVVWMQSGVYYFDFAFGASRGPGGTACSSTAPCTWNIDRNVRVVGGEPKRWKPTDTTPDPPFPGGCDQNSGGVQLVFGGLSRLNLGGTARMELCPIAGSTGEKQRIAVYGLTRTVAPPEQARLDATAHNQFVDPANAFQIGGGSATARLTSIGATAASIELNGFSPLTLLPLETVSKVTLRISHADLGDIAGLTATVTDGTTTLATFSSQASPCALCVHGTPGVDSIDITGALGSPGRLAGVRVRFDATLAAGGGRNATEALDGIAIDVSLGLPLAPPAITTLVPSGHNQFVAPQDLVPATASSSVKAGATVTLTGFDQVAIPATATIEQAVVHVSHHESAATTTVTAGGTSKAISPSGTLATTDIPLPDPAKVRGMAVTYDAALNPGTGGTATAVLDAIWVDVTYRLAGPPNTAGLASTGHNQFTNPASAFEIGEAPTTATADATLASGRATSAAITLTGFGKALPAADPISQVTLRVAHRDSGDVAGLKATVLLGSGSEIPVTSAGTCAAGVLCTHSDLREDRIAIGVTTPTQLSDLMVRYEVQLATGGSRNATEVLDGIWIEVQHGSPTVTDVLKPTGHDQFTNTANTPGVDGTARATLGPGAARSASITTTGYNQVSLPPGAVIDAVALRVTHADTSGIGSAKVTVTGAPAVDVPLHPGLAEDRIDLTAPFLGHPEKLAGLAARYDVTLAPGATGIATDSLGAVVIEVQYRRAPMLEALTGCAVAAPYAPGGPGCALFSTSTLAGTSPRLAVQGTVYAPTAAVALSLSDVSNFVLARGLVSRAANLDIRLAPGYARPAIIVPDDDLGPLTPRTRLFTAYIQDNGKVKEVVRASVHFDPAKNLVSVLSWSVLA